MTVVRLSRSSVGEEEKEALARVLDQGYLGMGSEVQAFESEIKQRLETNLEVICVTSGTAALHLAVSCLDIGPGDEVLVPTITYVASFQAVAATGARAIACDVDPDSLFLDLDDARARITDRTRAIMPVHYASNSTRMPQVHELAAARGLRVIEDAAHSFGGGHEGGLVGQRGDVLCFSFDGIKNITCGEGGAVLTGDIELAERIRDARLLGVEKDTEKRYTGQRSWDFDVEHVGFRYHMSNLMAAIGRAQLHKLDRFAEHRRRSAERYRTGFAGSNAIRLLDLDYENIVPHIFVVRVPGDRRDDLMDHLRRQGIECGLHYKPNHLLSLFADGQPRPAAEAAFAEIVSLPLHAELSDEQQDRVIAETLAFLAGAERA